MRTRVGRLRRELARQIALDARSDPRAALAMLAIAVLAGSGAVAMFERRDLTGS
jgi:hypothetical protein